MQINWRRSTQAFHLLPVLKLIWLAAPKWTIVRLILVVIQGVLPLPLLYFTKLLIDTVANPNRLTLLPQFLALLAGVAVVMLVTVVCNALSEFVNTAQSQQVTNYMQDVLHAKSIEIDLEYYENSDYQDTLQRAQQQALYRPALVVENVIEMTQSTVSLVGMVALLLSLNWGVAGILFVAAIPTVLVRLKFVNVRHDWYRRRTALERQNRYLSWLLISDWYAKEIRLFNLGQLFRQRFNRQQQQLYRETLGISQRQAIANGFAQVLAVMLTFAAYAFIAGQAFQGKLQVGDLVLCHEALQRGQTALRGVMSRIAGLYEDNLFLANLYEFLQLKPKLIEPVQPQIVPTPMRQGIVFDRVSFQYDNSARQAIQDISLQIRPGEVIALVGGNGSGKTTLVKLLCRLYNPTAGQITIDGIDLDQFTIADLRRQISVVFQDYAKYQMTAQENIWLGNIELSPDHERIFKAAYHSGADAVIQGLPQGYDTILGKYFENGEELSLGQWQKVALARAFLREAQVIILDEPTSAIDPEAEAEIFQSFRQLIQHQSAILVSHRLSTVKLADCIYVMDNGCIVERGTHEELMRQEGKYAFLFETQAQSYR